MTTTTARKDSLTSANTLAAALGHGFAVQTIAGASDEHGMPCQWCDDNAPCVTNVYFIERHGGVDYDETAHTCASAACVLAATVERTDSYGGDVVVEVSTAVVVPVPRVTASW